jgi:hypothetical protein
VSTLSVCLRKLSDWFFSSGAKGNTLAAKEDDVCSSVGGGENKMTGRVSSCRRWEIPQGGSRAEVFQALIASQISST